MASTDATPFPIKNQAFRVTFPLFDNDGDLVTGAAGLDSEVSKDAGSFADCTNEATEIATSSGIYYLDLTATEMNADTVAIIVKTSTTDAKTTPIILYPQDNGLDRNVNITHWNGTAVASPDTAGYPVVTVKDGTGQGEIALTSGAIDNVTLVATTTTNTDMRGTDSALLASNYTAPLSAAAVNAEVDTALSDYDAPTRAELTSDINSVITEVNANETKLDTIDSNVDAILVDTNELQTNQGNWLTATGFSTHSAADVWTATTRTLSSFGTLVADIWGHATRTLSAFAFTVTTDAASRTASQADVSSLALEATLTAMKGATFDGATDSLEALRNQGDAAWVTATGFSTHSAANVRTEMDSNSTQLAAIVADTNELQTDDIPGLIGALNDISPAEVNAEVDTALSDIHLDHLLAVAYDATSKPGAADALLNEMVEDDSGVTRFTVNALENGPSGSGASASAIADAVWDEALGDHTTAGSAGAKLESASTGSGPSAADIADAVWDESTTGHTTAGTFGEQLKTDVDAILADTDILQSEWSDGGRLDAILDARASQSSVDMVDGNVDSILVDTGTTLPAQITALNDVSTADIDARLAAYDGPTRAELTSDKDEIITEINANEGKIDTIDSNVDAILVDTNELQTNQGSWLTATGFSTHSAANVRSEIDSNSTQLAAIVADTNELQSDNVPGLIAALNNVSTADIDARLAAYGAPTRAELTSDIASVLSAITGLNDPTSNAIADAILTRSVSNVEGTPVLNTLGELILGGLESSRSGTTWTIRKTDGTTTFNTRTLTVDANAAGVTGVTD